MSSTGESLRTLAILALAVGCLVGTGIAQDEARRQDGAIALVLDIRDAIGPATSNYFVRALERARESSARLVILQLDTPGGLDAAMRDMIRATLSSEIPVVTFIAPSGARAASAGTYLLYASHIAAMAPATNVGAATPVQIGAPSKPQPQSDERASEKERKSRPAEEDSVPTSAGERKAVNDAVAYIRGLAELRNRNADWAEAAVRSAASLSASQALEERVIDVVAADIPDLLRQIDGRRVQVLGKEQVLSTATLQIERIEPDWRTRVLAVLTNPNVAYLLMLAGVYGLLLEGYNPGAILPGVVGAISLLLALYALQILPVNYAGLGLMILGLALITAEAFAPSFGVLGVGGIAAFVVGSIILMDTKVPGFQVARALIGGVALTGGLVFLLTAGFLVRARQHKVVTGPEQLLREPASESRAVPGHFPGCAGAVRARARTSVAAECAAHRRGGRRGRRERPCMTEVRIPEQFWDGDEEGVIATWLFADGETVTAGAPLAEIMYEKASMELIAPASGILAILAPAEAVVRRGQVIASIA